MKKGDFGGYDVLYYKNGHPRLAGPRMSGTHAHVWDHWTDETDARGNSLPAVCRCRACGAEWPEGGERPETCGAA